MRRAWLAAALCCALPCTAATAQQRQVVIYRCTDGSGQVTLQNDVACPPGTQQRKQVIEVPPPLPSYQPRAVRMPEVVAEERAQADAAIAAALPPPVPAAERQPPPPLFQCSTWDRQRYLTEDATPQERCAPLQVVGLDGVSTQAAAHACQSVVDECQPVAAEALCRAWKQRVDEAEFRWKFAGAGADDARRLDYERLAATLANSACD